MQPNPFEPPGDAADLPAPAGARDGRGLRVYTPNHAALAAFIGSPIAGAWVMASNYAAFGKPAERWRALGLGLAATVAIFALGFVLPDGTPTSLIPVAYTVGLRELAKRSQGPDVDRVLAAGGVAYSGWRAAGIGFIGLVVIGASLFLGILVFAPDMPVD